MLWFGVHLPYLALEVFERAEMSEYSGPAVVTDAQRICLVNEHAQVSGIQLNASLSTARSLVPNVIHHARDRDAESRHLQQLVIAAYEFTPFVSVATENELLLEMAGSLKLFNGVDQAQRRVQRRLRRLGHRANIGIAHTPRASLAFAKSQTEASWPDFPSTEDAKGITLGGLRKTSLAHLELTSRDRERFVNMGMHFMGDLMDIPSHELLKRFGPELTVYLSQLTGDRLDPWLAEQPVESFSEGVHLIESARGKDEVLEPMEHLADRLSNWLERLNLGVRRLRWGVYTFEGDGATFEVGFEHPRQDVDDIMTITRLRMESVDLPNEAMTVSLDALRTDSKSRQWAVEHDLFGSVAHKTPPRDLLDRLTARLGAESLQQFSILDDHRPEFAWMPADDDGIKVASASVLERGRRPLWLLEPPKPVRLEQLKIVCGPERIQYGWWDIEMHRDYYVARDRDEALCWCYRDARGWFLHGYFA